MPFTRRSLGCGAAAPPPGSARRRRNFTANYWQIAAASDALPVVPVATTGTEPLSVGGVGPGPGSRCRPGALPRFAAGALAGLPPPAWLFAGVAASQHRLTAALCFADVSHARWFLAAFASALSVCPHFVHRNRAWLLRFSLVQCPHAGQKSDEFLARVSMYFAPWRSHADFNSARCSPGAALASRLDSSRSTLTSSPWLSWVPRAVRASWHTAMRSTHTVRRPLASPTAHWRRSCDRILVAGPRRLFTRRWRLLPSLDPRRHLRSVFWTFFARSSRRASSASPRR